MLCCRLNALIIYVQIRPFMRNLQGFEQGSVLLIGLIERSIIRILCELFGEAKFEFVLFALLFILYVYLELFHDFLLVIYVLEAL